MSPRDAAALDDAEDGALDYLPGDTDTRLAAIGRLISGSDDPCYLARSLTIYLAQEYCRRT